MEATNATRDRTLTKDEAADIARDINRAILDGLAKVEFSLYYHVHLRPVYLAHDEIATIMRICDRHNAEATFAPDGFYIRGQ